MGVIQKEWDTIDFEVAIEFSIQSAIYISIIIIMIMMFYPT